MKSFKNTDYIDILEIVKMLWVYKFMIIALAVVMGLLSVVKVEFFTEDVYVATGMLYLSNKSIEQTDDLVSQGDITTARSMSETYREILNTRTFMEQISLDIDKKFSWAAIKRMTSISTVANTQLLNVSVRANNPKDAYIVAKSIVERAPEKLGSVFNNGKVYIVDDPVVPAAPLGKAAAKGAVKGIAIGLFIGIAIVVIMNLMDTTVHKSDDVAKRYNVSVLGEIAQ